jgi:hypothetical protein
MPIFKANSVQFCPSFSFTYKFHLCKILVSHIGGYDDFSSVQSAESSALLVTCFMLVSSLAYSSTAKMEATRSSEKSVDFQMEYMALYPRRQLFTLHLILT